MSANTSSEGVDVLRVLRHVLTQQPYMRGNRPPSAKEVYAHENFQMIAPRIAELIDAADAYSRDYMVDEAEDDPKWHVCGPDQRKAAQRVFAAVRACRATPGERT